MYRTLTIAFVTALFSAACGEGAPSGGSNSSSASSNGFSSSAPSPIGGACTNDGQCAGSALCMTSDPGGQCSMLCTNHASVCGAGAVCVGNSTTNDALCLAQCPAPGTQSTCRTGYRCVALQNLTYGACLAR